MPKALVDLILAGVPLELGADDAPPKRIRMAAFGKNPTTKGTFVLTESDAKAMVAEFERRKIQPHADYEHAALHAAHKGSKAPAAAWYKLAVGADGLYAENIEWTPTADKHLREREYRYFSPWFGQRADGSVASFKNFALTNRPAMDALTPLVASEDVDATTTDAPPPETPKMKTLLKHLALTEDATEAEALAKLQALQTERDAIFTATATKDFPSALAAIETAKQAAAKATALAAELGEIKKAKEQSEKEMLLAEGVKEGKVPPALKDFLAAQDATFLKAYLEKAPKLVNAEGGAGGPTQGDPSKNKELELTEEEKQLALSMGNDLEKVKAHKKLMLGG
jgi:phage I-like protein